MLIDCPYNFGDIVYLTTDEEQSPRIITEITVTPSGILYCLNCGPSVSKHYDFEFTTEKNVVA